MSTVYEQLDCMRTLPENWDGYQAAAPAEAAIDRAQEFAAFIEMARRRKDANFDPLHVSPTRIGGVLIESGDTAFEHEVEIGPNGKISFLHVNKSNGQCTSREFAPLAPSVVHPGLLH